MRLRVILLVMATSSLVLISFLIPLALVLRTLAADRAVSTATAQAQSMAPLVTTLPSDSLRLTIDQINAETGTPVTIFLPSGAELGQPAPGRQPSSWPRRAAASPPRPRAGSRCWWPSRACPAGPL